MKSKATSVPCVLTRSLGHEAASGKSVGSEDLTLSIKTNPHNGDYTDIYDIIMLSDPDDMQPSIHVLVPFMAIYGDP